MIVADSSFVYPLAAMSVRMMMSILLGVRRGRAGIPIPPDDNDNLKDGCEVPSSHERYECRDARDTRQANQCAGVQVCRYVSLGIKYYTYK